MRSLLERIEQWLFKLGRRSPFQILEAEIEEARKFKISVEQTKCPTCQKPTLKLAKFERGPKGWEAEIICEGCNFTGLLQTGWTLLEKMDSLGKARD